MSTLMKPQRFVRLSDGATTIELIHVRRGSRHYVVRYTTGGGLSVDVLGGGSKTYATKLFRQHLAQVLSGAESYSGGFKVTARKLDSRGERRIASLDSPLLGIQWGEIGAGETSQAHFLKHLKKQIKDWKGSSHSLAIVKHPEWPVFHVKLRAAVRKKYGAQIKVYRGLRGKQAEAALAGQPIPVYPATSWARSKRAARIYAAGKARRGEDWAVIQVLARPEDVVLAPVALPDFVEPDILRKLAQDVEHVGDELVLHHPRPQITEYEVVAP